MPIEQYTRLVSGEAVKKAVSIEAIQELAIEMHESLRALAVTERAKPVFIGTFLVTAMSKMFKDASGKDIIKIRGNSFFGVESDDDIYTLAIANMIVRGDGKSNIVFGDCFNADMSLPAASSGVSLVERRGGSFCKTSRVAACRCQVCRWHT
ncbi:MAG: hypothetical protein LBF80_01595 [Spirochaetaceae bacterium]|jgi:hypothetical protein|nr:hypothetical protein [Spirochaetaceae bacterium]